MQTTHLCKLCKNLLYFIVLSTILHKQHISWPLGEGEVAFGAVALNADELVGPTATTVSPPLPAPMATTRPLKKRPPNIKLNKCCHYGEYLDNTQACVPGGSMLWVPLIFQVMQHKYAPKGTNPAFIKFEENARPIGSEGRREQLASQPTETLETNKTAQSEEPHECKIDELELFTGSDNIVIFSNGSLFVRERAQLIEPRHYCVDHDAALVCFPKEKNAQPRLKLRKCCGKQYSYDAQSKMCTAESDEKLKLPIDENIYQTVYGFPECREASSSFAIAGDWQQAKLNTETGHIQFQQKNFSASEYCYEHLREHNRTRAIKIFACLHHFAAEAPANSVSQTTVTSDQLQLAVLNVGIVISVFFLAATLVAGYLMPSVHHVLHWRCQIYYVFCLFVGDLLLAYTQLSRSLELNSAACLMLASAMHFFFLSAFFWLNTMCFNIWWTFRDFRPSSLERNQELLRLRLYSAYAWGIPLVISVIAVFVDHLPETQLLRPGFGVRSCWFSGEHLSIFAYFFGPVGILLCANLILFVSTTHQLTCGLWKRDDVKSTTEKTALGKVCLKLVVVMGVTWIADIISWLVGGPHSLWFFTDLINVLQGVFIFIVVGCQPQVWAACKRFCCPRSRQEITNTTNGVQHSSSSQGLPSMGASAPDTTQTQNTSITTTIGGNLTPAKIPMETVC